MSPTPERQEYCSFSQAHNCSLYKPLAVDKLIFCAQIIKRGRDAIDGPEAATNPTPRQAELGKLATQATEAIHKLEADLAGLCHACPLNPLIDVVIPKILDDSI